MDRRIRFFAVVLMPFFIFACHSSGKGNLHADDVYRPRPVVESACKAKVSEVFNDTHKLFDVDVIGSLWNGMEDSLNKRGMLWKPENGGDPYVLEGHVVAFKKGGFLKRCLPHAGDTVVEVRVELSQGGRHLATLKSRKKFACGKGSFTTKAWKKAFDAVSEDIVKQAVEKFKQ